MDVCHDLRWALQVSLQQNQPQHQMATFLGWSDRSIKEGSIHFCYHFPYITLTYHCVIVCKGQANLWYKTRCRERATKTTTERKTVPGTQSYWRNAPKSTTPPFRRMSGFNSRTTISAGNRRGWISANSPTLLEWLQVCIISFGKRSEMAPEIFTDTCAHELSLWPNYETPHPKKMCDFFNKMIIATAVC